MRHDVCNELTCNKLGNNNIRYRYYEPRGGPEEEGWSMMFDVYQAKDDDKPTRCYVKISHCPFCGKRLTKQPEKVQDHRK